MKWTIIITFAILFNPFFLEVNAQIQFDGSGRWSTSFEYGAECVKHWQFYDQIGYCQDIANDGIIWTGWPPSYNQHDPNRKLTSVVADASRTGNLGARFWVGDGTNSLSPTVRIEFPEPQRELWIRWYMRYQDGFQWLNHSIHYNKTIYIRTESGAPTVIPSLLDNAFSVYSAGAGSGWNSFGGGGWNQTYGPGVSDGQWHSFEIYIRMDTQGSGDESSGSYNGIARVWVNGEFLGERNNINYSNAMASARQGWRWFGFNENQNSVDNLNGPIGDRWAYVDYDDMTIYNRTPPNTDAHGNPFIGPGEGGGGTTSPSPAPPSSVTIRPPTGIAVY